MRDISDRKQAEAAQALSTELLVASFDEIDATIQDALARIGEIAKTNRSSFLQLADDGQTISNSHLWCAEGGGAAQTPAFEGLRSAELNSLLLTLRERGVLPIKSIAEIPEPRLGDHPAKQGVHSLLLIPLIRGEELTGFLGLDALRGERACSESAQHLLRIAADALSGALARHRLKSGLRYQAHRDSLTGLLNRHSFEEALVREIHRAQRYGEA